MTLPEVKFPDAAWTGLLARYRDLVAPCTEAPPEFHFASFIAAVGCLIGRKVWICTPHATYPNFYSLLVGQTAQARKTTAYQFALRLMEEAAGLLDSRCKRLYGLASVEGLAAAMKAGEEVFRILCVEDEFRSLVTKSGQRSVANIIPKITELYNCPASFEVNTKSDPIQVKEPFLCIISATTPAWFEESLSGIDVSGGFLNRWLLFHGQGEKMLAFPPALDEAAWDNLVLDVTEAIDVASGLYEFSQPARELYETFYADIRTRFTSEATGRMDVHTKKLSLLYAVLSGRREIDLDDVACACTVAEYCGQVVEPLAERLDFSPAKRLEERFLGLLRLGPCSARDAYRKLHVPAGELCRVAANLSTLKQVTFDQGVYAIAA